MHAQPFSLPTPDSKKSTEDNCHTSDGVKKVSDGFRKTVALVRECYGPAGGNAIIGDNLYPYHRVTNDGKTIVDSVVLIDPLENIGANIARELGDKADKDSGDGRKTTMIIADAILEEASKSSEFPMDIKRSLDASLKRVIDSLESQAQLITVKDVHKIAQSASESEEIGQVVGQIYETIGEDGIIEVEPASFSGISFDISEGVRLRNAKPFGSYSFTEPDRAVFNNPKILVSKDKITSAEQLDPLLRQLSSKGVHELVIYCEDIELPVAAKLAMVHVQGSFKTLLIKAPVMWKDWLYEDICALTGSTAVDAKEGRTFKEVKLEHLGTCAKISATKDEIRLIGTKDSTEHVNRILANVSDEAKLRVHFLKTKVATLRIGANSESELSYLQKKARDACASSYWALKEGIVQGGGESYCIASEVCNNSILAKALKAPKEQLIKNAGSDLASTIVDDPLVVAKNAVKNAVSVAGTIITAKAVVSLAK